MKCAACGYEGEFREDETRGQLVVIDGEWEVRSFFACPKCGTVKVEPELMEG